MEIHHYSLASTDELYGLESANEKLAYTNFSAHWYTLKVISEEIQNHSGVGAGKLLL